jgi:hypothetical protein
MDSSSAAGRPVLGLSTGWNDEQRQELDHGIRRNAETTSPAAAYFFEAFPPPVAAPTPRAIICMN